MKILMIAPEPFFEPRGTPFSEYFRIKALCKLGHSVDLVTYPFGENRKINGLRIFRCSRPPFIRSVKTGPSLQKVFLDFFLFFKVIGLLVKENYSLIHTHEEANIMGVFFNKITKIPHLYDMHASLVQHMSNFLFTKSKLIIHVFKLIEKLSLKNAKSTIVICRSLYDYASLITNRDKLTVIENFIDETPVELKEDKLNRIKEEIGSFGKKIIMYTGTLEPYQGILFLIKSMKYLDEDFRLVLIGGDKKQREGVRKKVEEKGLRDRIYLLGKKKPSEVPYYLKASDVLVSPRILGTNIPLKIYSYLKSGIPLVATNLYTHTQSINENIAILVEPEAEKFARGIKDAVSERGKMVAKNAKEFCEKNYSFERYLELVDTAVKKGIKK